MQCLEKDPAKRPQSAHELAEKFRAAVDQGTIRGEVTNRRARRGSGSGICFEGDELCRRSRITAPRLRVETAIRGTNSSCLQSGPSEPIVRHSPPIGPAPARSAAGASRLHRPDQFLESRLVAEIPERWVSWCMGSSGLSSRRANVVVAQIDGLGDSFDRAIGATLPEGLPLRRGQAGHVNRIHQREATGAGLRQPDQAQLVGRPRGRTAHSSSPGIPDSRGDPPWPEPGGRATRRPGGPAETGRSPGRRASGTWRWRRDTLRDG